MTVEQQTTEQTQVAKELVGEVKDALQEQGGADLDKVFEEFVEGDGGPEKEVAQPKDSEEPDDELGDLKEQMQTEVVPPFEGKVNDYELKLPKGIPPDHDLLQRFTALAKDKKVDTEVVQKSVEMLDEYQAKFFENVVKKDQQFRQNLNNQFIRQNKADPVYGGQNYDASVNYAMKALRRFVPKKELMATMAKDGRMGMLEYLNQSNSMNASPLWKFFVEVGKYVSESQPVIPGSPNAKKPSTAEDAIFGMIK